MSVPTSKMNPTDSWTMSWTASTRRTCHDANFSIHIIKEHLFVYLCPPEHILNMCHTRLFCRTLFLLFCQHLPIIPCCDNLQKSRQEPAPRDDKLRRMNVAKLAENRAKKEAQDECHARPNDTNLNKPWRSQILR